MKYVYEYQTGLDRKINKWNDFFHISEYMHKISAHKIKSCNAA